MTLKDWCSYDFYWGTQESCESCKLCDACKVKLHCQYDTFSDLIKLETKEKVGEELKRRLDFYYATYPPGAPSLKGKYFWSMSCDGRGLWSRELLKENLGED